MKNHFIFASFVLVFGINTYGMEQKHDEGLVKAYTLQEVQDYVVCNALSDEWNSNGRLLDQAANRENNLSTIISEGVVYKRLAVSSQETKNAFLELLQNRIMRNSIDYPLKDEQTWALIRTWIATCAMLDAKDDPKRIKVLGKDGCADELAKKAQDQGLMEILAANKERNK